MESARHQTNNDEAQEQKQNSPKCSTGAGWHAVMVGDAWTTPSAASDVPSNTICLAHYTHVSACGCAAHAVLLQRKCLPQE